MLTLNPSTLYYMNLSRNDTAQKNGGLIKDWASAVSKLTSKPSSTAGSRTAPRSTAGSSRTAPRSTTTQVTSQHSTTSTKQVIVPPVLPDDDIELNGLSDHDETIGKERDAAVNSPRKDGVRATSSVSTACSSSIYYMHAISNCIGHGESHHLRA
jgi:hypothetical protein